MTFYIASSGGHLSEILKLSAYFDKHTHIITENIGDIQGLKEKYPLVCFHLLKSGSRKRKLRFIMVFALNSFKSAFLLLKYRPKIMISTGSHTFVPFVYLNNWCRIKAKTIYIESIARVETLSKTGEIVYGKTDVFLVQWPELAAQFDKTIYKGRLL